MHVQDIIEDQREEECVSLRELYLYCVEDIEVISLYKSYISLFSFRYLN